MIRKCAYQFVVKTVVGGAWRGISCIVLEQVLMFRNVRYGRKLATLRFVNNLTLSEIEKRDKLWELRPWLDSFREKWLQVVPEEHNSVDDMIPFKGKFSCNKQYKQGFKVWVRAGISGMVLDCCLPREQQWNMSQI